ncbi:MAG: DUF6049 family protein [Acidimicrobiales bacterium]
MRAPILGVLRRVGTLGAITLITAGPVLMLGRTVVTRRAAPATVPRMSLASAASSIELVSQSPAFVTSQAPVSLGVKVESTLPVSRLALDLTLYSRTPYRSTLNQALSGDLSNLTPLQQASIPLSSKSLHWSSGKTVTLHLPISAPDLAAGGGGAGTGGTSFSLSCEPPYCGGVYPLQVAVFNLSRGVPLQSFTTYVIVTPPSETAGTKPLKLAWTVPLGETPALSASGAPVLDSNDISQLNSLNSVLAGATGAALTLDLFPQFVESIGDRPDAADQEALRELQTLAANGRVAIVPGTFTPTDLDSLTDSLLGGALAAQITRAREVLGPLLPFDSTEYVANAPISASALDELSEQGVTQLLMPASGAAPLSSYFSGYTPTTPFLIPHAGVSGIASDPGLEDDLKSTLDPALKAQRMLADLSVVYFEDTQANQVLALDTPLGMQLDGEFLADVIHALVTSPIVRAVSLPEAFKSVAAGSSDTSPGSRGLSKPPAAAVLPAAAISTAAGSLQAYQSMLPSHPQSRKTPPLSDLVLMAEGSTLTGAARSAYLNYLDGKAEAVGKYLSLPFGRVITVTSLRATIPISILSTSPVPIVARLSVSALDLGFPKGRSWDITIAPRTNIVKIAVSARTAGTFSLVLTLSSKTGYVMQSGDVTIQSTAISGVAVGLSAAAGLFLLVWWLRSIIQRRRKRHRDRGAALAAGAMPEDPTASGVAVAADAPDE